jgi:SAM-dependent methyltransferase
MIAWSCADRRELIWSCRCVSSLGFVFPCLSVSVWYSDHYTNMKTYLKNLFTHSPTAREQKEVWEENARDDAAFKIWSGKRNPTAEEYRESGREHYERLVRSDYILQDKLKEIQARAALDLGCGNGRMTEFFKPDFEEVYGLDISGEMIRQAKERLPDSGITFIEGDGLHLPDISVDFVFSLAVFHHMARMETIETNVREVYRVLRPGGVFKLQLRGNVVSKKHFYYGVCFDANKADRLFRKAGFQTIYTQTHERDNGKISIWGLVQKPLLPGT